MLKLIILRLHKQKTSQKIVLFLLKVCFLTFIYEFKSTNAFNRLRAVSN